MLLPGLLMGSVAGAQEMAPGLAAAFYDMQPEELAVGLQDFPVIPAGHKPTVTRADAMVNIESTTEALPGTEMSENVYIRWTGKIRIATEAEYTFTTESDDGSR